MHSGEGDTTAVQPLQHLHHSTHGREVRSTTTPSIHCAKLSSVLEQQLCGTNMAANIDILAEKGIMVGYGSVLKPVAELPFLKMMFKNITLSSILVYLLDADEAAAYAAIVGDMLARGALDVPVGHVLPLADAAQAHELVEGNERSGAVILGID